MMTDAPRYRALNSGLRRLRQAPFSIRIAGQDPLELASEDVGLEGANASFQVHLRVAPAAFTCLYNAVQLATAPVLAVSGNSPTFLGRRLWEETRIALYKQSVDDRPGYEPRRRLARATLGTGWLRGGPLELFAEGIRLHRPLLPVVGRPADLASLASRPDKDRWRCQTRRRTGAGGATGATPGRRGSGRGGHAARRDLRPGGLRADRRNLAARHAGCRRAMS
jgi:hypothetical protein